MKRLMWCAALLLVFSAFAPASHADTTFVLTATNPPCIFGPGQNCGPDVTFSATITTTSVTGLFYNAPYLDAIYATENVVTGITGLYDGDPISYVAALPVTSSPIAGCSESTPCITDYLIGGTPIDVVFSVDGETLSAYWDGEYDFVGNSIVNFSETVITPEPSVILMLLAGLVALLGGYSRSSGEGVDQV
jgi:hypothetical protein